MYLPMIDDVVNDRTKFSSVKAREGCRHTDEGRNMTLVPVRSMSQTEVLQHFQVGRADDVMGLVYQHELVPCGIELEQSFPRRDALNGGDGDVCCS